ncbi:type IV pilin N-terminal domain-containing protein [Halomicroarcula sp. S1AR25-4]|uniref:type IV pilin n=1 Tax=unclassified Haloarcula TaxID=2624677 RepID=UPI00140EEB52|nr:type IV pilin N-terminal domain-containing protein [Halomicroarcula sp. S1AR25-4]MDS0277076.1 type IV pilin N-terminal domain-containing protein [Halomicroarcula sp. S1AR25-4]QIO22514.1 type IV pilin [Haloarcula sp. JP-L23]
MDLKQLINDDDAVSPVIGVILMVAITVILAAVIASFVLGLGDQAQQTTPQASFAFDYDESVGGTDEGVLTITHDGGDTIQGNSLYLRGSGFVSSWGGPGIDLDASNSSDDWQTAEGLTEVSAGSSIDAALNDDYQVRVVYEPPEGDTSATLAEDDGPEA